MLYITASTSNEHIMDLTEDMARRQYSHNTREYGTPNRQSFPTGTCWQWYTDEGIAIYLFQYKGAINREDESDLDHLAHDEDDEVLLHL